MTLGPLPKRIAVVGSRDWVPLKEVHEFVMGLPEGTTIVSGGALGVDTFAANAARSRGFDLKVFLPDYKRFGKRAPLMRNQQIAEYADAVFAFWTGESPGTRHIVGYAKSIGKPVRVRRMKE